MSADLMLGYLVTIYGLLSLVLLVAIQVVLAVYLVWSFAVYVAQAVWGRRLGG